MIERTLFSTLRGASLLFVGLLTSPGACTTGGEGLLVPATVMSDPALPRFSLTDGRFVHLQTFGDPARPTLIVLHGGPGGDRRVGCARGQWDQRSRKWRGEARGGGAYRRRPAGPRRQAGRPGPGPGVQPVRRDDAAHGLVLHVLELRQQHGMRIKAHPLRPTPIIKLKAGHPLRPTPIIKLKAGHPPPPTPILKFKAGHPPPPTPILPP